MQEKPREFQNFPESTFVLRKTTPNTIACAFSPSGQRLDREGIRRSGPLCADAEERVRRLIRSDDSGGEYRSRDGRCVSERGVIKAIVDMSQKIDAPTRRQNGSGRSRRRSLNRRCRSESSPFSGRRSYILFCPTEVDEAVSRAAIKRDCWAATLSGVVYQSLLIRGNLRPRGGKLYDRVGTTLWA